MNATIDLYNNDEQSPPKILLYIQAQYEPIQNYYITLSHTFIRYKIYIYYNNFLLNILILTTSLLNKCRLTFVLFLFQISFHIISLETSSIFKFLSRKRALKAPINQMIYWINCICIFNSIIFQGIIFIHNLYKKNLNIVHNYFIIHELIQINIIEIYTWVINYKAIISIQQAKYIQINKVVLVYVYIY